MPTPEQHLLLHRQFSALTADPDAALAAAVAFSPPDAVAAVAVVDGTPWLVHLAEIWGQHWGKESPPSPSAKAAWSPWLPEAEQDRLRPCEWPLVASLIQTGASPLPMSPELLRWATVHASKGLWDYFLENATRADVQRWGAWSLPLPAHLKNQKAQSVAAHLASSGRTDILKRLVGLGLDINQPVSGKGHTVLHEATSPLAVDALLEAGADPLRTNAAGHTAIQHWDIQRLDEVARARMVALVTERHPAAEAEFTALFRAVALDAQSAPWEKIVELGWNKAIEQIPPPTTTDKHGFHWSLLATLSRTLHKTAHVARRQDLLVRALSARVDPAVWTHESIPGVPDVFLAAAQAVARDLRKDNAARLHAAQLKLYPTLEEWRGAFTAAMASWSASRVRLNTSAFLKWLTPVEPSHIASHPFPDWMATPAAAAHAAVLAPIIQEAWVHSDKTNASLEAHLTRRWQEAEDACRSVDLVPWAPALLGMAVREALHGTPCVDLSERIHRWQVAGVDFRPALAQARTLLDQPLGRHSPERALGLLAELAAWEESCHLGEALPAARRAPASRRM